MTPKKMFHREFFYHLRDRAGFSIIEFLIVIGLVSLITTVSIASFNSFQETSKLKNEVQHMVQTLSLAQKRATTGENITGLCGAGYSFSGVVVTTVANGGYTLQGQCSLDSNPTTTSTYSPIAYTVEPSNINIVILTSTSITFPKLTGIPTADATVVLKNTSNNTCATVSVNSGIISSDENSVCP